MFSVELLPDEVLDGAVRDDWSRLAEADLPSSGRNSAPSNRPHVTVAVRDRVDVGDLEGLAAMLPLPVELSGVLLFGRAGRFVLTRQVVVNAALLDFHARVAERLGPPEARYANTAPDRWSPHMTLARGLDAERLSRALCVADLPFATGDAIGLRVWDAGTKTVTTLR